MVTAQRCPGCGAFGPPGTDYCAFCGTRLSGASGPPGAPGPLPPPGGAGSGPALSAGAVPYYTIPPATPPVGTDAEERRALRYVALAGLLVVVAGALSIGSTFVSSISIGAAGRGISLGATGIGFTLASGAIEVAVVGLVWMAMRRLVRLDRSRFETPARLTILGLVGLALVLATIYPLLSLTASLGHCVVSGLPLNNTTGPPLASCQDLLEVAGLALVLLVGGILGLIGFIAMLIGIWRLGSRYQNSAFQIGAILLIFPIADIAGGILLYLAAQKALAARPMPGGPPPTPPF